MTQVDELVDGLAATEIEQRTAFGQAFAYSIVPDRRSGKQQAADLELLESVGA